MIKRILILFFLMFCFAGVQAQLQANFTVDKASGCSPLQVSFTNTSSGASAAVTYKWDFGNSNSSTLVNPATTYISEQTYTVTLTATDGGIKSTISKTITVYKKPVVNFSTSTQKGCVPLAVKFTSNSKAGDGTISNYLWDFGDGTTINGKDQSLVNHTYIVPQKPPVSLTVTNSFGCYETLDRPDILQVYKQVQASFTASQTHICSVGGSVQFTNTSTGDGTLSYSWDFGDGEKSNLPSPAHVYNTIGSYTVRLLVRNDAGCASNAKTVTINVANFTVDFSLPTTYCVNQVTTFPNKSTRPFDSSKWLVNNISVPADVYGNLNYRFPAAGNYDVKLISYYQGCQGTKTKQVTIGNLPVVAGFITQSTDPCVIPTTFTFTDTTADAVKWVWKYKNNSTIFDSVKSVTRTYADSGSDRIGLTVTNQYGCTASRIKQVNYYNPNLSIYIKKSTSSMQSPNRGCPGLNVTFSTLPLREVTKFSWDFGDGTPGSTAAEPSHIYRKFGNYQVKLVYETKNGCKGTLGYDSIYINDIAPFDFTVSPDTVVCGNSPMSFSPTVALENRDYIWLVNGKQEMFSLTPEPFVYHFHEEGYYTISLVMQSGSCKDTVTKVDYIHVLPPFPDIGEVLNTCNGDRSLVTINDSTYKSNNWHWDFGDGNTLNYTNYVKTLTHNYAATGSYKLKLTVTNGSCIVSDSVMVNVLLKQKPLLSANSSIICTSDSPLLSLSNYDLHPAPDSSEPYSISKIQFGDLTSSGATIDPGPWTTSFNARINGLETDKQNLRLITTSHYFNCEDTSNFIPLKTNGPLAAFSFNKITCFKDSLILKDASVASSKTPIIKWEWFFGDSTSKVMDNRTNVTYHFKQPGDYYLQLEVTDSSGCSYRTPADSAHMVSVSGPVTAFDASATDVMVNTTVQFLNRSTYTDNSEFFWKLPGGLVATEKNPSFLFEKEGQFPVFLITRNLNSGCTDTARKTITVKRVQSIFTYSISYTDQSNCPPVIASFTSQSLNAEKVRWTFGDGGEAGNDPEVSHVYANAGIYTVTLYSYDAVGSIDSAKEMIEVKGPYAILKIDTSYGCTTLPVRLSADTVNTASFKWDFGDGTVIPTTDIFATHTYTTPGIYTPSLILADNNGCISISELGAKVILDSLNVNILPDPSGIICDSSMVKFSSFVSSLSRDSLRANLDYYWTSSLHPNDDYKTESALWFFNRSGLHDVTLTVTSPYGCKKDLVQQVEIKQGVKAAISAASLVCLNDAVVFKGSSIPAQNNLSWQWDLGNNVQSQEQNPAATKYPSPGPQNISLVVSNGSCTDTARIQLDVRDKPVITVQSSKPYVCLNDTASLTASGGISINWTPAPQSQSNNGFFATVRPSVNTRYKAVVTDSAGCSSMDSVEVKVVSPFLLKVQSPVFTCSGKSIQLNASGAANYQWSGGGFSSGIANPVYVPLQSGQVKVVADDGKNCFTDSAIVNVQVGELPLVDLGPDQKLISGQEIQLRNNASGDIVKWNWQPGQYLQCTNCPSPFAKPLTDITYSLTVTKSNGCTATDSIRIEMICGKDLVWIPTGFTPNGDNLNDRFAINGSGIFIKRLAIFDRWGKLIFERRDISPHDRNSSWDGNYNGQPMAAGAYVYALEVLCNSGEPFTFKGTVTLVR